MVYEDCGIYETGRNTCYENETAFDGEKRTLTRNYAYGQVSYRATMETYESMPETAETDAAILEAETEYARDAILHDARSAFDSLRRKHFG